MAPQLVLVEYASYLALASSFASWFRYRGQLPPHLPVPHGRRDYYWILETGVLPESHERDGDIQAALARRRQRWFPAARWIVAGCLAMASVTLALAIAGGETRLYIPAALWLVSAWAIPRRRRAELARWDRIEAELDRRRRDGPRPVVTPPPPDLGRPHRGNLAPGRRRSGAGPTTT